MKKHNLTFIIFIIFITFINIFGIGNYGLMAKDEPRYAGCALEMIENNDFITPKFNFQDRFDKPIFYYWLIAASYMIFGVNDFASRLPSVISSILLILFTYYTVLKIFGKRCALISGIILATSVEYLMLSRRAATDIVLTLFFSGTMYSMFLGYFIKDYKKKIFWTIMAGMFAGLSILTKGPIGIIFPFIILTGFILYKKSLDKKHIKVYSIIAVISIIVSLPWYIAVHIATKGEFTKVFFLTHNFERVTSVVGQHPGPFWFYFPVLFVGLMPWTFLFIYSSFSLILRFIKKQKVKEFIVYCFIWVIFIFLFFSLCKTKLATYILLIYPPIAIITGYWINIFGRKYLNQLKEIFKIKLCFLSLICLAVLFILPKTDLYELDKNNLKLIIIPIIAFFIVGSQIIKRMIKAYTQTILAFALIVFIPTTIILTTSISSYYKITFNELKDYAILAKKLGASEIISYAGYKPILVYYGRIPVDFNTKKVQINKINELLINKKNVYIIGYLSDINEKKSLIKKNKNIFNKLEVLVAGRKYFLGRFTS